MTHHTLHSFWDGLAAAPLESPAAGLAQGLLVGSVGAAHLMGLADTALQLASGDRTMLALGRELLLAAWECDPLEGGLAAQVVGLDKAFPWLDPATRGTVRALVQAWRRPDDLRYYERLAGQMDFPKLQRFLDTQQGREPGNPYWLQQILAVGELGGDLDWLAGHLERPPAPGLELLHAALRGRLLFAVTRYEDAASALAAAPFAAEHHARALSRCGREDEAMALWARLLRARPWHTTLALGVHDRVAGLAQPPGPGERLGAPTAVCVYSWNKADDLERTIAALAAAAEGWDHLFLLDNGSTDATPALVAAWAGRFGPDRCTVVTLPVNIGAPAARNWLARLPVARGFAYTAFLDDDADPPPHWLGSLARAVSAYPDAGVWGCRVLDQAAPHIIQSADLHVRLAAAPGPDLDARYNLALAAVDPFTVSTLHNEVPDLGQFDYLRPCASVTGCCHLFRSGSLLAQGDFSLSLSPSQFDDLEHDLRLAAQGGYACYQGHLAVGHRKRSGKAVRASRPQRGNATANKYKLHHLYPQETMRALVAHQDDILFRDASAKLERLDRWLAGQPA
ncbi:MAG: glycosyltransferase [Desulfovibrionaceae bacterium]